MDKLFPCPFCGGEARIKSRYIGYGSVGLGAHDWYTVECNECRAKSDEYGAELEAIAAWNRRAQPENEPIVHCAECEHYTPSPMGGKGCEYCLSTWPDRAADGFSDIWHGNKLSVGYGVYREIGYCPMCGKRLEVEP